MRLKVAVLEDDVALREDILVPQLAAAGFVVEGFGCSADLYRRMVAMSFDLLVLDLRLGNEDGLEVARYLRGTLPIGIVMLTGLGSQAERIQALMETVDAWLIKPADMDVLAATLHSIARRLQLGDHDAEAMPAPSHWGLAPGGWCLQSPDQRRLALNLHERRLLTRLFATPGELVTHEELVTELAEEAEGFDRHRLEILIHRLRRKVSDRLAVSLPLRSVRGSGYVMLDVDERGLDD